MDVPIIAAHVPVYAHPGDAGADLVSAEELRLGPGERALVATGVRIALPDGYVAFVVPRSGLAGDRIAQLIVMPVPRVRFVPVDELPESARGEGGFGSTGYQTGAGA
ncbi:MAG: dUTP diphosphatase [Microbacterium sp.]|nr:MAG: dUTP diphosphatase [Microbacterium sp.]PZU36873.1 MAG: dUTP diphosphatase [Microbacterium sp.]